MSSQGWEVWARLPVLVVAVPAADGETRECLSAVGSWPLRAINDHMVLVACVVSSLHLWLGPRGVSITASQPGVRMSGC